MHQRTPFQHRPPRRAVQLLEQRPGVRSIDLEGVEDGTQGRVVDGKLRFEADCNRRICLSACVAQWIAGLWVTRTLNNSKNIYSRDVIHHSMRSELQAKKGIICPPFCCRGILDCCSRHTHVSKDGLSLLNSEGHADPRKSTWNPERGYISQKEVAQKMTVSWLPCESARGRHDAPSGLKLCRCDIAISVLVQPWMWLCLAQHGRKNMTAT